MTLDEAIHHLYTYSSTLGSGQTTQDQHEEAKEVAIDTMRKYQQLRADCDNRLKADMVTMLDELDLELYEQYEDTDLVKVKYIRQSIQQKIDKLKRGKMTKEEKIKGLYSLKEYLLENPIELEGHESLPITLIDYAIEVLEQEPNEVCDWFKQYIDIPSNTVLIEFSDGTSKRVKRGEYLANVENDLRRMMQVQIERESYKDAKQLRSLYDEFARETWSESEDVRGDNMIKIKTARQILWDLLYELGVWDEGEEAEK